MTSIDLRAQIREFLRTRRARITPAEAGLTAYGGNRRVSGLRREEVAMLPGVGWCMACAQSVPMKEVFGECPQCGGYQMQVTGGTEMRVKDLEVT